MIFKPNLWLQKRCIIFMYVVMNIIKCESTACLVVFGILSVEFSFKSRDLVNDFKLEFMELCIHM